MVLLRAPLGRRGSYLATALNVLQCLGWAIFELIVIATAAAAALATSVFGFEATWLWTLALRRARDARWRCSGRSASSAATCGARDLGRARVARSTSPGGPSTAPTLSALWSRQGQGGSFWAGVDLVIALTVSWLPLVADYTRFSRDRAQRVRRASAVGYLAADAVPVRLRRPARALAAALDRDPTALIPSRSPAGGPAAALALLALTVDETDEAFANIYSTAVSLQNLFPAACRSGC